MRKTDAWLPLYVADYMTATTRLTTEQHGAYLLIIMDYWRNGPPPDDDAVLARVTGLTLARWKAHRPVIQSFFQLAGGMWHHKRIDTELLKANAVANAKQNAGRRGGEARAKSLANAKRNPTPSQSQSQSPTPSQSPSPAPSQPPESQPRSTEAAQKPRASGRANGHGEAVTAETWTAYSGAYLRRYGVEPKRNATVNGQLAHFVGRIGAEESPAVAAFYVEHNQAFYVKKQHPVGLLLQDAEGLHTQWLNGRVVTDTEARQTDQTAATGNVFKKLIAESEGEIPEAA